MASKPFFKDENDDKYQTREQKDKEFLWQYARKRDNINMIEVYSTQGLLYSRFTLLKAYSSPGIGTLQKVY